MIEVENLNLTQVDVIADLKTALEACEEKLYNEGFVDAENSAEPCLSSPATWVWGGVDGRLTSYEGS